MTALPPSRLTELNTILEILARKYRNNVVLFTASPFLIFITLNFIREKLSTNQIPFSLLNSKLLKININIISILQDLKNKLFRITKKTTLVIKYIYYIPNLYETISAIIAKIKSDKNIDFNYITLRNFFASSSRCIGNLYENLFSNDSNDSDYLNDSNYSNDSNKSKSKDINSILHQFVPIKINDLNAKEEMHYFTNIQQNLENFHNVKYGRYGIFKLFTEYQKKIKKGFHNLLNFFDILGARISNLQQNTNNIISSKILNVISLKNFNSNDINDKEAERFSSKDLNHELFKTFAIVFLINIHSKITAFCKKNLTQNSSLFKLLNFSILIKIIKTYKKNLSKAINTFYLKKIKKPIERWAARKLLTTTKNLWCANAHIQFLKMKIRATSLNTFLRQKYDLLVKIIQNSKIKNLSQKLSFIKPNTILNFSETSPSLIQEESSTLFHNLSRRQIDLVFTIFILLIISNTIFYKNFTSLDTSVINIMSKQELILSKIFRPWPFKDIDQNFDENLILYMLNLQKHYKYVIHFWHNFIKFIKLIYKCLSSHLMNHKIFDISKILITKKLYTTNKTLYSTIKQKLLNAQFPLSIRLQNLNFKSLLKKYLNIFSKYSMLDSKFKPEFLFKVENQLRSKISGQNAAINSVIKALKRFAVRLNSPSKPLGSFFFCGTTGVGKTELCKILSQIVFGSSDTMIRLDMSEYKDVTGVSRLIGTAAGYIGYGEKPYLIKSVSLNPHSLVLCDEVEKAHIEVMDVFLQIVDEGRLTDAKGNLTRFNDVILVMTSNEQANRVVDRLLTFKKTISRVDAYFKNIKPKIIESKLIESKLKKYKKKYYNMTKFTHQFLYKFINILKASYSKIRPLHNIYLKRSLTHICKKILKLNNINSLNLIQQSKVNKFKFLKKNKIVKTKKNINKTMSFISNKIFTKKPKKIINNAPYLNAFISNEENKLYQDILTLLTKPKGRFRPEFINRFDYVVPFEQLSKENFMKIYDIKLNNILTRVHNLYYLHVFVDKKIKEKNITDGYSSTFGARPIVRLVSKAIEDPIADAVLRENFISREDYDDFPSRGDIPNLMLNLGEMGLVEYQVKY